MFPSKIKNYNGNITGKLKSKLRLLNLSNFDNAVVRMFLIELMNNFLTIIGLNINHSRTLENRFKRHLLDASSTEGEGKKRESESFHGVDPFS